MEEALVPEEMTEGFSLPEENTTIGDNYKRGKTAYIILWIIVGLFSVCVLSDFFELKLLREIQNGNVVSEDQVFSNDLRQRILGILQFIMIVASGITFICWFRRAYGNVERAGISINDDEKMALWYFFIPIICFFKPPQIMHEIWDKTQSKIKDLDKNYEIKSSNYLISIWWMFYIVSNFIGRYIIKSYFQDQKTVEDIISLSQANIIADSIKIIEGLVLLYLIYQIRLMEIKFADVIKKNGGSIITK